MTMHPEQLIERLNWRYAVKKFDPTQTIPTATWQALEQALVLSPSSYGLQPWRFVVVTDATVKAQLPAMSWNQAQPKDCSHMVVFAARESLDAAYLDDFVASTESSRGLDAGSLAGFRKMLASTVESMESHFDWNCRQVYIALGQLMTAAAMMGIDACPMEGIVPQSYDSLLGLSGTGYRTVVGCAMGYRDASDKLATTKKFRFPTDAMIQRV